MGETEAHYADIGEEQADRGRIERGRQFEAAVHTAVARAARSSGWMIALLRRLRWRFSFSAIGLPPSMEASLHLQLETVLV